jgi:hypothetical protein
MVSDYFSKARVVSLFISYFFHNCIMASPFLDTASPLFDHYQNNWILPEECIYSSQPSLFLLDMEKVKKQEALDSTFLPVIVDEEQSDKVDHPIHGRPDCVVYPFRKDPELHCETCWCITCEVPAAKCKSWNVHCREARKQVKSKGVEKIESGVALKKGCGQLIGMKEEKIDGKVKESAASKNEKAVVPHAVKAAASKKEKAVVLHEVKAAKAKKERAVVLHEVKSAASKKEKAVVLHKREATNLKKEKGAASNMVMACNIEDAEKGMVAVKNEEVDVEKMKVAAEQLKGYLCSILEMDAKTLKGLCKEKEIPLNGRATLKHKYAFALFCEALMQP